MNLIKKDQCFHRIKPTYQKVTTQIIIKNAYIYINYDSESNNHFYIPENEAVRGLIE